MKKQNKVKAALQSKRGKRTKKTAVPEKRFELLGKDTYQDVYGKVGSASADSRLYTDKQLRDLVKNSQWDYSTKSAAMKSVVEDSKGKVTTADVVALMAILDPGWRPEGRLAVFFSYRKQYRLEHSTPAKRTRK